MWNNYTHNPTLKIANACEHSFQQNLYRMFVNPSITSPIYVYVWASSFEDAFEELVEWADDHAPGSLVNLTEKDLKESANELGIQWDPEWPDWDDRDFAKVVEQAEADLTMIGHTTLKHGQYIASDEWGGDDVVDDQEYATVKRRSIMECSGKRGSWGGRKGSR